MSDEVKLETGTGVTLGSGAVDMYARERAEKLNKGLRIKKEENAIVINNVLRLKVVVGDNIMILEDEFKSSYDCKACGGAGKIRINCLKCEGTGYYGKETIVEHGINKTKSSICGKCDGIGYKDIDCGACRGKGALVEIPNESRKKPTSGTIVSAGPDVKIYKVGDRVCYSSFIGHFLPFNANDRVKVMREHEAMCILEDVDSSQPSLDHIEFSSSDNPYEGVV
ncbi:MAG TPA: hypothetical protein VGF75_08120 [Candidatus Saccharimonadales bacterium]|jgi:co-chaperonin GroES (HSP10)